MNNFNSTHHYVKGFIIFFLIQIACLGVVAQEENFPYPEIEWATYFTPYNIYFTKDGDTYFGGHKSSNAYEDNPYDSLETYVNNPEHAGNWYFGKLNSNQNIEFIEVYGIPLDGPADDAYGYKPVYLKAVDQENNFYITGMAREEVGIGTPEAYHENFYDNWTEPRDVYLPDLDLTVPVPSEPCQDAFIMKYDENGNKLWGSYYNGNQSIEFAYLLAQENYIYLYGLTTSNEGIATQGTYMSEWDDWSTQLNPRRFFVQKIDAQNGMPIWGTYLTESTDLQSSSFSYTTKVNSNGYFFYIQAGVLKVLSPDGQLVAENEINLAQTIITHSKTDKSGNYFLIGNTTTNDSIGTPNSFRPTKTFNNQRFVIKYNQEAEKQWGSYLNEYEPVPHDGAPIFDITTFADKQDIYFATATTEEGLASNGAYQEEIAGGFDVLFMKLNGFDGSLKWASYFGGENDDFSSVAIHKDIDQNLYLNIYITESPADQLITENALFPEPLNFYNSILVKFLHENNVMTTNLPDQLSLKLYPNPAQSRLHLQSDEVLDDQTSFAVYDLLGRKTAKFKANQSQMQSFDISHLNPGTYFLEINHSLKKQYLKFVKQ